LRSLPVRKTNGSYETLLHESVKVHLHESESTRGGKIRLRVTGKILLGETMIAHER
jgi:hypothetical protein